MTTIVAAHGNGGGSTRFSLIAPHLPAGIEMVAIDLPGFNGVPAEPSLQSVADYADRLHELLADIDTPRVLLGHGIGGSFALDLVSRRPEAVDGLILHAPVAADLDQRLFPRIMSTGPVRELVRRMVAARLPRPLWRRIFFPNGAPAADLDTFFDGYRTCASFGQMFDIIDAAWFDAVTPVHDVPAILLWGEHDRVLRSGQAERVATKVPDARAIIQPGWDHFPMLEQPEEYARVVAKLATELVAAGP